MLFLVVLIVALAIQNRELKQRPPDNTPPIPDLLGQAVPPVAVRSMTGVETDIAALVGERAGPGAIAVLTTTCDFCEQTLPHWRSMANEADGAMNIVALSLDLPAKTARWIQERAPGLDVYLLDPRDGRALGLEAVPTTIVYDRSKRIVDVRRGAIGYAQVRDIFDRLSIDVLPTPR